MGAEIDEAVFDDMSLKDLGKKFDELVESRQYDHGHSGYSGTFAEVDGGVVIDMGSPWVTEDEARQHLREKIKKWEPAHAVRYKSSDHETKWLVMAMCSS